VSRASLTCSVPPTATTRELGSRGCHLTGTPAGLRRVVLEPEIHGPVGAAVRIHRVQADEVDVGEVHPLYHGTIIARLEPLMSRIFTSMRVLVTLWISLVMTVSGAWGAGLCIGHDGHVALEPAHEGRCHGHEGEAEHAGHHGTADTVTGAGTGCEGDCIDVSLAPDNVSLPTAKARHDRLLRDVYSSAAVAPGSLADSSPGKPGEASGSRSLPPWPPPALFALRTVVLHI